MADDRKFGFFESNPAIFTDTEAWVFQHDGVWREMNPAEVRFGAGLMTEAAFKADFGALPALPKTAFQ
jgi:hypothetical protein